MNSNLRPVVVSKGGKKMEGFFHRFVYQMSHNYSETKALIELADGRLRYFDPFYVQFTDRIEVIDENDLANRT